MTESIDDKIAAYCALKPTQFSSLSSLTIRQGIAENGEMEQSLSIVLRRNYDDDTASLVLDFVGVRCLEIRQSDLSEISLPFIEVLPGYTLPQVEGRYLVRDPEQERSLWFECRDFVALIR